MTLKENPLKDLTLESLPALFIIIDKNYKIQRISDAINKKLLIELKSTNNISLIQVCPFLMNYEDILNESIKNSKNHDIKKIKCETKESILYFNLFLEPLNNENEDFLLMIFEDVTKQVITEEKLIHYDKLALVGLLMSDIANEIDISVNNLSKNIKPLRESCEKIIDMFNMYLTIVNVNDFSAKKPDLEKYRNVDLNELLNTIEKLTADITQGINKSVSIVSNFRDFIRPDESIAKYTNLHEGIDATLDMLQHKMTDRISVIKEYGDIPRVVGFTGKLNQMLMNILANAIEAIPEKGEIRIKTSKINEQYISINISDNGVGIKSECIKHIFEPFFTTKAPNKSTGLGLFIAANIIAEHRGTIKVTSKSGANTEFIITLPIDA